MRNIVILALGILTPITSHSFQHDVRRNRVWTLRINIKTCGLSIHHINSYRVLSDRELGGPIPMRLDYFYLQWAINLPEDKKNYKIGHLLIDMGQEIYLLYLTGVSKKNGLPWKTYIWVSPVGYSTSKIPFAPKKTTELNDWITDYHEWSSNHIWRSFSTLSKKYDVRVDMPITLNAPDCEIDKSHVINLSL